MLRLKGILYKTLILQMKYLTLVLVCLLCIKMCACRRSIDSSMPNSDLKVMNIKSYKCNIGIYMKNFKYNFDEYKKVRNN